MQLTSGCASEHLFRGNRIELRHSSLPAARTKSPDADREQLAHAGLRLAVMRRARERDQLSYSTPLSYKPGKALLGTIQVPRRRQVIVRVDSRYVGVVDIANAPHRWITQEKASGVLRAHDMVIADVEPSRVLWIGAQDVAVRGDVVAREGGFNTSPCPWHFQWRFASIATKALPYPVRPLCDQNRQP
jgi:hypothetical protein